MTADDLIVSHLVDYQRQYRKPVLVVLRLVNLVEEVMVCSR